MDKYKEPEKGLQCKDCICWRGDDSISMAECKVKESRGEHDYVTNALYMCDEWVDYPEEKEDLGREKYE